MKIALFSDIRASLPALEAVLADIDSRQPDAVYCLGNRVGYNIWPNNVVNIIRQWGIPTIDGITITALARRPAIAVAPTARNRIKANRKISIAYTNAHGGNAERQYLRTLPTPIRVAYDVEKAARSVADSELPAKKR